MDLAKKPSPAVLIARSTASVFMRASQPQVYLSVNRRMVSEINRRFHSIGMRSRTHPISPAGQVILDRLEALKQTQQWLADKVEVSKNAVTKWIRTGQIARENLPEITKWLELKTIDELVRPGMPEGGETPSYSFKEQSLINAYWGVSDEARSIVDRILLGAHPIEKSKRRPKELIGGERTKSTKKKAHGNC